MALNHPTNGMLNADGKFRIQAAEIIRTHFGYVFLNHGVINQTFMDGMHQFEGIQGITFDRDNRVSNPFRKIFQ